MVLTSFLAWAAGSCCSRLRGLSMSPGRFCPTTPPLSTATSWASSSKSLTYITVSLVKECVTGVDWAGAAWAWAGSAAIHTKKRTATNTSRPKRIFIATDLEYLRDFRGAGGRETKSSVLAGIVMEPGIAVKTKTDRAADRPREIRIYARKMNEPR